MYNKIFFVDTKKDVLKEHPLLHIIPKTQDDLPVNTYFVKL